MKGLVLLLMFSVSALLGAGADEAAPVLGVETEPFEAWQACYVREYIFTDAEVDALARLVYGEARNCNVEGQAGTVWCVLNRVDSDDPCFPDTVMGVITQPRQFAGYKESNPVLPELVEVVEDVLMRWSAERSGVEDVGRVLPREYLYFSGDGERNCFTITYAGGDMWDWSARSPYREIP